MAALDQGKGCWVKDERLADPALGDFLTKSQAAGPWSNASDTGNYAALPQLGWAQIANCGAEGAFADGISPGALRCDVVRNVQRMPETPRTQAQKQPRIHTTQDQPDVVGCTGAAVIPDELLSRRSKSSMGDREQGTRARPKSGSQTRSRTQQRDGRPAPKHAADQEAAGPRAGSVVSHTLRGAAVEAATNPVTGARSYPVIGAIARAVECA